MAFQRPPSLRVIGPEVPHAAPFVVAGFFTRDYAARAERLARSCIEAGVAFALHEVGAVHRSISPKGSLEAGLSKPDFILDALDAYRRPVLYVDIDCVLRAYPAEVERLLAGGADVALYNWLADADTEAFMPVEIECGGRRSRGRYYAYSHRMDLRSQEHLICSGCTQVYAGTAPARVLLEAWRAVIAARPGCSDDACLNLAYNNLAGSVRAAWLPKAYARYSWWIFTAPVIDHPDPRINTDDQFSPLDQFGAIAGASGPWRARAGRPLPTPGRFPELTVLDVVERRIFEFDEDRLLPVGSIVAPLHPPDVPDEAELLRIALREWPAPASAQPA
jgi:hypothetical protein